MKKSILIFCATLLALGITSCAFSNKGNIETVQPESFASNEMVIYPQLMKKPSGFIHDIGPRYKAIKKSKLDNAKSLNDFIGKEHQQRIVSYKSLSFILLNGDKQTDKKETGPNGTLTDAQIKLLQSANCSSNIMIKADYIEEYPESGLIDASVWTPYFSVVPEKQAVYLNGKEALVNYLKENSAAIRANAGADKLKPAKLLFTVTKNGAIKDVKLERTSGYPSIDKMMIKLITKTPGMWKPAENSNGEKVDQDLAVTYGSTGC